MLRARFITCFIWISSNVIGERPNYAEIVKKAEDLRTFRGSSSFSGKTHALDQTFQGGSSFLADGRSCNEEKDIMEEIFRSLGLGHPPGSYCTWSGVHCDQCHVTELRLEQPQDVRVELSPELGRLHRLKNVDLGGAVALTANIEALRNATLLEKLNLSHSQVQGDLEVFENHPKLQHLDLENILVKGSINVFSHTKDLRVLRLTATLVEGSIEVFKNTPNLQELSIENAPDVDGDMEEAFWWPDRLEKLVITNSNVSGNFHWERARLLKELRFEHLPHVEVRLEEATWARALGQILSDLSRLILTDTNVFGRLEDFHKASSLLELQLRPLDRDQVTGNIGALASLSQLQVLSLEKMNVEGNLKALRSFSLRTLHLAHTKVMGSIKYLDFSEMKVLSLAHVHLNGTLDLLNGTLKRMQVMNLQGTRVKGNLQVFEDAKDLRELNLGSTDVVGDIEVFKHTTELRVLNISETLILGDIHAFQALPELREVRAWFSGVHGDISVFMNKTKLKTIYFAKTFVYGDIQALREATGLEGVGFVKTEVLGDIRVFEHALHLKEAWLSGTSISGNIKAFGNSRHLERVFLCRTAVSGNIQAFEAAHQLIQLGLDGTKVEGDVGIFRRMPRLELLTLDKNPEIFGNFTTFYKMESLQTLGLEGCNITGSLYRVAPSLRKLRTLRISRTPITGKLSSFTSLRRLQELHAAAVNITGDIRYLTWMAGVRVVDLSRTRVSGRISSKWLGKVQKLRSLDLSASHVALLPSELELVRIQMPTKQQLLPALETLQVSGCPLSGKVEDFFRILVHATRISQISASGCNLTGTLKDPSSFRLDDAFGSTVKDSLLVLDVSNNSIQHVECLPRRAKIMLSHNNRPLNFSHRVLAQASDNKQELDLRGSRLASFDETHELWMQGKFNWTTELSARNTTAGYGCFGLDPASTTLLGFGPDLLPDEMCGCLAGFFGKGTTCALCNDTSYNEGFNQSSCTPCPASEMRTEAPADSQTACKCSGGRERVGDMCGCAISLARGDGDVCVHCKELNLNCSEQGMMARNAPAVDGYARLEPMANHSFQCFPPALRCNHSGQADQNCAQGYQGILCMDCVHDYFASSSGRCWPCQDSSAALSWRTSAAAVCIAAAIIALAAWIGHSSADGERVGFRGGYLMELKQNAPVLLQTCQLWAVLSALSTSQQGTASAERLRSLAKWEAEFPELPVIAGLGFSLVDLQGIFDFQCMMDGAVVRYWKALLAPVLPLIFLILCGFFELVKRGSGISKGLLVLSIFFVGGASSCAKLASCQHYDAGGRSLGEFAFQELMPSLKCSQRLPEVDGIYHATFFCYLIPIPAFLLYLFAKQHVALQPTKLLVSFSKETTSEGKELHFARIPCDSDSQLVELKDEMLERRMVAGAVAYSAVFLGDQVQVNLKKTTVMVKGQDSNRRPSDFLGSETLESFSPDVAELKRHSDALRCRAIAEMLMERCVLFERCELAPSHERDRVLSGARDMLMKYAACQNVVMEIVLKLITMSLVSVVRSRDGLQLSLAVTLVMATVVAFLRPYAHAQVNNLQCCCFISLAIAALSFSLRVPALSRVSLILPFLVALGQVWLPESPEVRASRIWQELEPKLLDLRSTSAGITASAKTLSITVHQSKEGN